MIVRSRSSGWRIVYHSAHGLLAHQIADVLDFANTPPYWHATRVAIGMHDDQKLDFCAGQRKYLTKAGIPRDFTLVDMDDARRVVETRRRLTEANRKHRWVRLLLGKHVEFLYGGQEDASLEMMSIIQQEQSFRQRSLETIDVAEAFLQLAYDWMRWCDRFSLILAGDDVPTMGRRLEVMTMHDGTRFDVFRDEEIIRVEPWPFAVDTAELMYEFRMIEQPTFGDDAELAEALDAAEVQEAKVRLVKLP